MNSEYLDNYINFICNKFSINKDMIILDKKLTDFGSLLIVFSLVSIYMSFLKEIKKIEKNLDLKYNENDSYILK